MGEARAGLQISTPLGNAGFRAQIEQALGLKVGHRHRGRPRKRAAEPVRYGEQGEKQTFPKRAPLPGASE